MAGKPQDEQRIFPTFALRTPAGELVTDQQLFNHPAQLVVFFKKHCETSATVLHLLRDLWQEHRWPAELVWLISQDEPSQTAQLIQEWQLPFLTLVDAPAFSVSRKLDFSAVPAIYLVDKHRSILLQAEGFYRDEFETFLNRLLEANGIPAKLQLAEREDLPVMRPG